MVATLLVTVKMMKCMLFGTCVHIHNFAMVKMSDTASKNLFLFFLRNHKNVLDESQGGFQFQDRSIRTWLEFRAWA